LMQLFRAQILNFLPKQEKSFITQKKNFLDNGDRWENVLAANIKADNPYR